MINRRKNDLNVFLVKKKIDSLLECLQLKMIYWKKELKGVCCEKKIIVSILGCLECKMNHWSKRLKGSYMA